MINGRGEPAEACYTCGGTDTREVDETTRECAGCGEYAVDQGSSTSNVPLPVVVPDEEPAEPAEAKPSPRAIDEAAAAILAAYVEGGRPAAEAAYADECERRALPYWITLALARRVQDKVREHEAATP